MDFLLQTEFLGRGMCEKEGVRFPVILLTASPVRGGGGVVGVECGKESDIFPRALSAYVLPAAATVVPRPQKNQILFICLDVSRCRPVFHQFRGIHIFRRTMNEVGHSV